MSFVIMGTEWHVFVSLCPLFSYSHCISQILESVNHIHQHDIVHRDLKVSGCPLLWQPHTHTHLCSWPWQHTDGSWLLHLSLFLPPCISASISVFFFSCSSLPSTVFTLYFCIWGLSLTTTLCLRMCTCMHVHVECRDGESWSRGGGLSHLWQGKDKDSKNMYLHKHTFMLPSHRERSLSSERRWWYRWTWGVATTTHVTSHHPLSSGGGFELSQIADRCKCKE